MALAVDSADLILREVFKVFSSFRDGLAILGTLYATRKTASVSWYAYNMLKTHVIARIFPVNLRQKYGSWAVVTGCTRGIGQSFCEELAGRGIHLLLVSRDPAKLNKLSQYLEENFDVQTAIIVADFNEGRTAYINVRKGLEGKDIGILVNNVGVMYDYPMNFLDVAEDKLWQLVNVNVAAATMMTHIVLPGMVERSVLQQTSTVRLADMLWGRGAVITMASAAGTMPSPLIAVYSATKVYLDYFCKAVNYEYRKKGITVQCLMPYYVSTHMTQYSSSLSKPSMLIPSANTFVHHALSTLGWADRTTGYWPHTIQMWLAGLVPEWLWMWGSLCLNAALRHEAHVRIRHRSGSRPRSRPSSAALLSSSPSREQLSCVPSSSSSLSVDTPSI